MKIVAFSLCWVLILAAPGVMAQQTVAPNQSWDTLRRLQAREKLRVERKAGKKVTGKMISLSDTELVIERKRKNVSFMRDEVKKVWRIVSPSDIRKALSTVSGGAGGFAIGLVTAFLITQASCHDGCGDAEWIAPMVVGSVVGGLIGYFAERDKRTLIYSAP
jgi:hypothetical protein